MQVGQSHSAMQTMNQCLYVLYAKGEITLEDAMARSSDRDELESIIEQGGGVQGRGRPPARPAQGRPGGRNTNIRYT